MTGSPFEAFSQKKLQETQEEETRKTQPSAGPDALHLVTLPADDDADIFKAASNKIIQADAEQVTLGLRLAAQHDPDTFAAAKRIADRDGYPIDFAIQNLPSLKKREIASEMRILAEKNPTIKEILKQRDTGAIVKVDDLDHVDGLQWAFRATGEAFSRGAAELQINNIGGQALREGRALTADEDKRVTELELLLGDERSFGADGWFDKTLTETAKLTPGALQSAGEGVKGGTATMIGGTILGAVAGAAAGGVGAIPGAYMGWQASVPLAGAVASGGAVLDAYGQEGGGAYLEYRKIKDANGRPIDDRLARIAAAGVGLLNASLELGADAVAIAPGVRELVSRFGARKLMAEALRKPEYREVLTSFLTQAGVIAGTQVGTEVLQEAVTLGMGELAKLAQGGNQKYASPDQWMERIGKAAEAAAQFSTLLAPIAASPAARTAYRNVRRAEESAKFFTTLQQKAAEFELKTRSPETADAVIRQAAKDSGMETVYVPVGKLDELFQQNTVTPADMERAVPGFSEQYAEAQAAGRDIEIPFEAFHNKIAGTPLGEAMINHVRFDPAHPTLDEAKEFRANQDALLADFAADVDQRQAREREEGSNFNRVMTDRIAALEAVGMDRKRAEYNAAVEAAWVMTQANRGRGTVDDLMAALPEVARTVRAEDGSLVAGRTTQASPAAVADASRRENKTRTIAAANGQTAQIAIEMPTAWQDAMAAAQARTSDPVPDPAAQPKPEKAKASKRKPMSLVRFIAKNGGLELDGDARASDYGKRSVRGVGKLAKEGGKSIDGFWRERLIEEGYLLPDADGGVARDVTKEIYDLIDRELSGDAVYSQRDLNEMEGGEQDSERREIAAAAFKIRGELFELGVRSAEIDETALQEAGEAVFRGWVEDGVSAYEIAIMSRENATGDAIEVPDVLFQRAVARSVTQTPEFKAWFGDSKVVDESGQPLVVYHGTDADFEAFQDVGKKNSRILGNGFYFTTDREQAAGYGKNVFEVYLRMERPRDGRVTGALPPDSPDFDGVIAQGTPGTKTGQTVFVVRDPTQIKSVNNRGAFDANDPRVLYQAAPVINQNLIVQHNLTADNLIHADKMRGLAVPSVAVSRVEHPLDGFGEISLLGSPDLVDPKKDKSAKTFDADVYSPRYPTVRYKIAKKPFSQAWKRLDQASTDLGYVLSSELDDGEVERNGIKAFENSSAVQLQFLRETGRDIELPVQKPRSNYLAHTPELRAALADHYNFSPRMYDDAAAMQAISDAVDREIANIREVAPDLSAEDLRSQYVMRDGQIRPRVIEDMIQEVRAPTTPTVDRSAARRSVSDAVLPHAPEFKAWVQANFTDVLAGETIQTETASGDWRYLPHTLDNVVKVLKKNLQDGEGFNYGVGSIRSVVARKFTSVKQIQAARDRIIPASEMQAIKDEASDNLTGLADRFAVYAKGGAGKRMGFLDSFSDHLKEVAERGARALDAYYDGLPADMRQEAVAFLDKLANLPTEYFEAKLQRAVELKEFKAAVIPSDTPQEARDVLAFSRVPVYEYNRGDPASRTAATQAAAKEANLLFQELRGSITFGDERPIIQLFEAEDASTFQHEAGHFYLRMARQFALREGADPEAVADWNAIKDYLGVGEDNLFTVEMEEKWARSWEAYLMEGRSPSARLSEVFAKFRQWLIRIYKSAQGLNVEITPDVRQVMDRLVASDEEVETQTQAREYQAAFKSAEEANMSGDQYVRYLTLATRADDEAKAELTTRLMEDIQRESDTVYRERKREIRDEVQAELREQRPYRVRQILSKGKEFDGTEVAPAKIDTGSVIAVFGREVAAQLQRQAVPPILSTSSDAIHIEDIAEIFGYGSAQEMVRELTETPALGRAIAEESARRLSAELPSLLENRAARQEAALNAIHNDARLQFIEAELVEFAKRAGQPRPQRMIEAAKQAARQTFLYRRALDIKPHIYRAAEARAAREVEKALSKQDWHAAAEQKRRQLWAHAHALEAKRAQDDIRKAVKYLSRFANDKRPGKVAFDYLDQIDALLERFEVGNVSAKALGRRSDLRSYVEEQEELGNPVAIPDKLLNEAYRKNWKEMTTDEMLALQDAVKQLENLGRLKKKILDGRQQRDFEAVKGELIGAATAIRQRGADDPRQRSGWGNFKEDMLSITASFLRMEQVVDWLDGGNVHGPWRRVLWERMSRAQVREMDMQAQYTAAIIDIFNETPAGYLQEKFEVPSLGKSYTREQLYAFALNTGSESNLDKMMRGEDAVPGGGLSTPALMSEALDHLTEQDWDRIQKVWDTINSLWPDLAALQKRLTGVEPEKILARSFTISGKQYAGGYYPMVYDSEMTFQVARNADTETQRLMADSSFIRPTVMHGHREARTKGFAAPISTDLRVVATHITKVIHDITHWEAVRDTYKVLSDPEIRGALSEALGRQVYGEMIKWTNRIANDRNMTPVTPFEKKVQGLRSRIALMGMGYRVSTMLMQFVGWSNSMELVKPRHLIPAMMKSADALRAGETHQFIIDKSGEMRHRGTSMERDIREHMRQAIGGDGPADKFRRFAFYGITMIDRVVTDTTWLGAYNQHLEQSPGDDAGAVTAADRAVRMTQGAGAAKDISSLQANRGWQSLFTMFYSYFNLYFNRLWDTGRHVLDAKERGTLAKDMPHILARVVAHTIVPAVLADLLVLRGPDDDEIEEDGVVKAYTQWAALKVLLYPLASVPIVREVATAIERGDPSLKAPYAQPIETATKLVGQLQRSLVDGEDLDGRIAAKRTADLVGYAMGLPVGQFTTTGSNIWMGIEQEDFLLRDLFLTRNQKSDGR